METPEQKLQVLRNRIDTIDDALGKLFIQRIRIIREVAELKAANWPNRCHIRPGREGEMHRAIADRYKMTDFPPLMALAMWRQLIGGSTHLESPLNVSYLAEFPEHQFLAREYFGIQVGATKTATLEDAVQSFVDGKSNILILPTPRVGDWWRQADLLLKHGLYIFAALPVAENNAPHDTVKAIALAPIVPEDSGDDISYFLSSAGALEIVDGFTTTHNDSTFLGAHPRPILLDSGVPHA